MNRPLLNIFLLVFIILTWGYSWVLMKIGLDYMGPFTYSAWRCGIGGLAMIPLLYLKGTPLPERENLPDYFAVGFLQTTAMFGFLLYGMQFVTAGKSSVLLYTMPIWTTLLVHFYLKDRLAFPRWAGVASGGTGILFILGWDTLVNQSVQILLGEFLIIGGAVCWAVSNVWIKNRMGSQNMYMVNGIQLLVGAAGLAVLASYAEGMFNVEWNAESVFILLFTGIVASAVDFTIWFYLIKTMDINIATFSSMLVPVCGLLLDRILLGTDLDIGILVGGIFILAGIYMVSKKRRLRN